MKNLILIFFMSASFQIFSQAAVVNDVMANQSLSSQLVTSGKQLSQLERSYEILKQAQEQYKKINSVVTSVAQVGEIIDLQRESIQNVNLILANTKRTGKSRQNLVKHLNTLITTITQKSETISNVLNEGFFTMNDKDRLDLFQKERSDIFSLVVQTRGMANPYRNRD